MRWDGAYARALFGILASETVGCLPSPEPIPSTSQALEVADSECDAEDSEAPFRIAVAGLPGAVQVAPGGELELQLQNEGGVDGITTAYAAVTVQGSRREILLGSRDLPAGEVATLSASTESLRSAAERRGELTLWAVLELPDREPQRAPSILLSFQRSRDDQLTVFDDQGREELRASAALESHARQGQLLARLPPGVVADRISPVYEEPEDGEGDDGPADPDAEQPR